MQAPAHSPSPRQRPPRAGIVARSAVTRLIAALTAVALPLPAAAQDAARTSRDSAIVDATRTPAAHDPRAGSLLPSGLADSTVVADTAAGPGLATLLTRAMAVNPSVIAANQRVRAADARISPAGLPPDPMLMAGVQNFPLTQPGFGDFMTMKMLGVSQTIPLYGKLGLRERAATLERDAAVAALEGAKRTVARDVKSAYYDLAFADQALGIVQRNRDVLGSFIRLTETRYGVGATGQQDVLRAQVEATRLAETAVTLTQQRRAALARLNALLDRPSDVPVESPAIPERLARAAVARSADSIRFTSAALGSPAAGSPFGSLAQLQAAARSANPELREADANVAVQAARLELARREYLPDPSVSVQYGQRQGFTDMISATVSIPLPLFKRRRQDQLVAEASAQLAALTADRRARANALDAEVARLVSELQRQRTQLALYVKALLPQGRASLASATASYQVGRVEFLTLLDNQSTIFNYETEYFRALSDFATNVAELEQLVGEEVIQ